MIVFIKIPINIELLSNYSYNIVVTKIIYTYKIQKRAYLKIYIIYNLNMENDIVIDVPCRNVFGMTANYLKKLHDEDIPDTLVSFKTETYCYAETSVTIMEFHRITYADYHGTVDNGSTATKI